MVGIPVHKWRLLLSFYRSEDEHLPHAHFKPLKGFDGRCCPYGIDDGIRGFMNFICIHVSDECSDECKHSRVESLSAMEGSPSDID